MSNEEKLKYIESKIGEDLSFGNVLEFIENERLSFGDNDLLISYNGKSFPVDILRNWNKKDKDLRKQDQYCVNYVFNLLNN